MSSFFKISLVNIASMGLIPWRTFAIQWQTATAENELADVLSSFKFLKDIHSGLPTDLGKAASAIGSIVSHVQGIMGGQSQTLPPNLKPFVLVSQPESGVNWVSTLLDSHPDIITIPRDVFAMAGKYDGTLEDAFLRESAAIMQKLAAVNDTNSTKWFGIRVQTSQVTKIQDGLKMANTTFIFHWRRNVLRQLFPSVDSQQNHMLNKADCAGLECNIAHTLFARSEIYADVVSSGSRVCPVSHLEDWVAPSSRRQVEQSIFSCLHVEPAELVTPYASVQKHLPLLAGLANADEVKLLLMNSRYRYMLEEAATESAVLAALKASDAFDKQPPPEQGCWWENGLSA